MREDGSNLRSGHLTILSGVEPQPLGNSLLVEDLHGHVHEGMLPVGVIGPPGGPETICSDQVPVVGLPGDDLEHGLGNLGGTDPLHCSNLLQPPHIVKVHPVKSVHGISDGVHLVQVQDHPDSVVVGLLTLFLQAYLYPDCQAVSQRGDDDGLCDTDPVLQAL